MVWTPGFDSGPLWSFGWRPCCRARTALSVWAQEAGTEWKGAERLLMYHFLATPGSPESCPLGIRSHCAGCTLPREQCPPVADAIPTSHPAVTLLHSAISPGRPWYDYPSISSAQDQSHLSSVLLPPTALQASPALWLVLAAVTGVPAVPSLFCSSHCLHLDGTALSWAVSRTGP